MQLLNFLAHLSLRLEDLTNDRQDPIQTHGIKSIKLCQLICLSRMMCSYCSCITYEDADIPQHYCPISLICRQCLPHLNIIANNSLSCLHYKVACIAFNISVSKYFWQAHTHASPRPGQIGRWQTCLNLAIYRIQGKGIKHFWHVWCLCEYQNNWNKSSKMWISECCITNMIGHSNVLHESRYQLGVCLQHSHSCNQVQDGLKALCLWRNRTFAEPQVVDWN